MRADVRPGGGEYGDRVHRIRGIGRHFWVGCGRYTRVMSALDTETVERLARVALAADQPYLYCRVVPVLSGAAPESAEWILGYLKALVQLGLHDAARDLLVRFEGDTAADPQVEALTRAVSGAPRSRIPWTSRRRRFEANVAALSKRDVRAAEAVRSAWGAACERYEMHACADGNIQVRDMSAVWPARWVRGLDDHKGRAASRINVTSAGILPPPLLFEGMGLGLEILEGYRRTRKVFLDASAGVYIVEPSAEATGIAFHLHDWREVLADESVYVIVGCDASARLGELLSGDDYLPLTDRYCYCGDVDTRVANPATSVLASVGANRQSRAQALRVEIGERYAGRDACYWARRYAENVDEDGRATGRRLRVIGITSLHTTFLQYSMRDCLEALEALGHETRLLIEPAAHKCLDPVAALSVQRDFEPDVVLLLSRMRYEMTGLIHEAIPSVSWDQDALPWVFDPQRNPALAWNDFLMGFSAANAGERFGWPAHRLMFCPMAGGADTYSSAPLPASDLAPFRSDVSYVSHASATVEDEAEHAASWLSNGRHREVLRAAIARIAPGWLHGGEFPGPVMRVIVDTGAELGVRLSNDEACQVSVALLRVGDRAFRHVALEWVADWADRTGRTFHLWGNGWDRHPRLARYARGATGNGEELRRVYQASAINLQLMGYGFIHQRALDGLMAGGFFMTRRSRADVQGPDLRELVELLDACGVSDSAGLVAMGRDGRAERIRALLTAFGADPRVLDARVINAWRCGLLLPAADEVIPGFREMSFTSAREFEAQAERFLASAESRGRHASEMREVLMERYSYGSRMGEMLGFLSRGFRVEADGVDARAGRTEAAVVP